MKKLHIATYTKMHSQEKVGRELGMTQGAVSQMLKNKREVYIEISDSGEFIGWHEIKTQRKVG